MSFCGFSGKRHSVSGGVYDWRYDGTALSENDGAACSHDKVRVGRENFVRVALPAGFLKVTQEHKGKLSTHMRPSGRVAVEGLIRKQVGYMYREQASNVNRPDLLVT